MERKTKRLTMNKYKSIFISDIHLGTEGCSAKELADFLKNNTCDRLYLVGDIVDGWALSKKAFWPQSHSNVVRRILTAAKRGTKVYWIVGNHDEVLRNWFDFRLQFGHACVHARAWSRPPAPALTHASAREHTRSRL